MRILWDKRMKRLFRVAPRDIVEWLFPGASFVAIVANELEGESIFADELLEVTWHGKRFLLHVEFQKRRDARMAERLWEYNVRATLQYDCPVWSCVIYLRKDGSTPESFLAKELPTGQLVHHFNFDIVRLWEIPTRELWKRGLLGLIPLMVLTQEGTKREVVEEAIEKLTADWNEQRAELLALTYGLASLAFEDEDNQDWLIRRFEMLYDILKETRAFQELTKEGREEGREEGLKEGLKEGLRKGREEMLGQMHQRVLSVVVDRFPKLVRLARKQLVVVEEPAVLLDLLVQLSAAQTAEEARAYLLAVDEEEEENDLSSR